jgi:hypothetical protein
MSGRGTGSVRANFVQNGHSAAALATEKISKEQELTLELLTETVVWAARYPSPTKDQ